MIETFASEETEKIYNCERSRKLPVDIQRVARRKLVYLNDAENLRDIRAVPGNRFEELKGNRAGQFSIRINDQWRLCFRFKDGNAFDVEIVDYH